MRLVDDLNKL